MAKIRIRKSYTGKLHIAAGPNAAWCSAGNRGMSFTAMVSAKNAFPLPKECFCKKCFGSNPYETIDSLTKQDCLE